MKSLNVKTRPQSPCRGFLRKSKPFKTLQKVEFTKPEMYCHYLVDLIELEMDYTFWYGNDHVTSIPILFLSLTL